MRLDGETGALGTRSDQTEENAECRRNSTNPGAAVPTDESRASDVLVLERPRVVGTIGWKELAPLLMRCASLFQER